MFRFTLLITLLVGITLLQPPTAARAAPPRQFEGAISAPRANSPLQGLVSIQGTANHPEFWKYEVRVALGLNPNAPDESWIRVLVSEQRVTNGQLAVWDTTAVPDGSYILRLRVVRLDGNWQDFDVSPITVANSVPVVPPTNTPVPPTATVPETPTVAASFTPSATPGVFGTLTPFATFTPSNNSPTLAPTQTVGPGTPTVGPGTPTVSTGGVATLTPSQSQPETFPTPIVIDAPTIIVASTTATPTRTGGVAAVVATPGQSSSDDNSLGLPELPTELADIETGFLADAVTTGISITIGAFLIIGLIVLIRTLAGIRR